MENELCPVCLREMIRQENKTNPKAPDWKCSDRNCKFQWDKQTKQYIPSQFVTGVWDNKYPHQGSKAPYNSNLSVSGVSREEFEKSMEAMRAAFKEIKDKLDSHMRDYPPIQ